MDHLYTHQHAQSSLLKNRTELEEGLSELKKMYPDSASVPFINDALGLVVKVNYLEVWQGSNNSIHDRRQYTLSNDTWHEAVLVP